MKPEHLRLLRRLALNDREAVQAVLSGELTCCDERIATLVRIATLLSMDSDLSTFQWAVELGIAAGVDDGDIFNTVLVVAPIIGTARLNSSLPHLLRALELEVVED